MVRTDHYSLKFFLDQRLSTVPQHQWINKLFGFDFSVEYRPGRLNTVADALSRRDTEAAVPVDQEGMDAAAIALSGPSFVLLDDIRRVQEATAEGQQQLARHRVGELEAPWRLVNGLLLHGTRVFVPDHGDLRHQVLPLAHSAGHEGVQKTLHRLHADFYIPRDRLLLHDWVRSCTTCQRNKTATMCLDVLTQV